MLQASSMAAYHLRLIAVLGQVPLLQPHRNEDDDAEHNRETTDDAISGGL